MQPVLLVVMLACVQQDVPVPLKQPGGGFSGTVTAIDASTIKIRGIEAEFRGITNSTYLPGITIFFGKPVTLVTRTRAVAGARIVCTREGYRVIGLTGEEVVIREVDQPSRTFIFSKELAAGGVAEGLHAADAYRVRDVKVGDRIAIRYTGSDKEICTQICIFDRPGGLVPPSPGDNGDSQGNKYHEWRNAENDWILNGTPIPDRFLPPWKLEARYARMAPPPRVVVPRIPKAEP